MKWWPLQWNASFLAMCFTGLQFTANPKWYVAGAWIFIAFVLLVGSVVGHRNFRLQPWFLLLFLLE